ncbi:MAG: hypothetical protein V8K32_15100 [Candidatus Electrothrix gigas]
MTIQWIGPSGGLGNRILGIGSVLALSKIIKTTIAFPWESNSSCPADYHDLFEDMPGIIVEDSLIKGNGLIGGNRWEPIMIFREFKKEVSPELSLEEYCFSFVEAMRSLKFKKSILDEASSYYRKGKNHKNLAIHVRRTDRIKHHKNSLYRLLSANPHRVKRNLYIIRNTGVRKTLQYALLPKSLIRSLENRKLAKLCNTLLCKDESINYSIYADSNYELVNLQQCIYNLGISERRYLPSYCNVLDKNSWGEFGKRQTSVEHALIELLCMSMSSGILQNISTSSFSICSSIIGSTPILTSQSRHLFWRVIKQTLGKYPYEIQTTSDTMPS